MNDTIYCVIIAILTAAFLFQNYKYEGAKEWIIALRKENKDLRGVVQRKAKNAAEMYGDLLIMEKAIQEAQNESERLKGENKLLKTHLKTKTQLLEQLQRGAFNG